jgi:hypothetical protein
MLFDYLMKFAYYRSKTIYEGKFKLWTFSLDCILFLHFPIFEVYVALSSLQLFLESVNRKIKPVNKINNRNKSVTCNDARNRDTPAIQPLRSSR